MKAPRSLPVAHDLGTVQMVLGLDVGLSPVGRRRRRVVKPHPWMPAVAARREQAS